MKSALEDKAPWIISTAEPPLTLEIVLVKQIFVLSWNQFVYAEGSGDEVRIAFASHDVTVKGIGLDPLLCGIAGHLIALIREPIRSDRFSGLDRRFIREIKVRKIEVSDEEGK